MLLFEMELYEQSLEAAKQEMSSLLRQKKQIEERIAKLAPVIEDLSVLCDSVPPLPSSLSVQPSAHDVGLTDAIRLVFRVARPSALSPTEVRDKLRETGFDLDRYKYELPPIHNTILRLLNAGEIEEVTRLDSGRAYLWVSSLKRALLEIEPDMTGGPYIAGGPNLSSPNLRAAINALGFGQPDELPQQPKKSQTKFVTPGQTIKLKE